MHPGSLISLHCLLEEASRQSDQSSLSAWRCIQAVWSVFIVCLKTHPGSLISLHCLLEDASRQSDQSSLSAWRCIQAVWLSTWRRIQAVWSVLIVCLKTHPGNLISLHCLLEETLHPWPWKLCPMKILIRQQMYRLIWIFAGTHVSDKVPFLILWLIFFFLLSD